jgi:hypothetical protein
VKEEAERTRMSIHKLRDLVRTGSIPARRIGGARAPYLLCPDEVDQAIDRLAGISPDNSHISAPPEAPAVPSA